MAEPVWQCQYGGASMAVPVWQCQYGGASMAVPGNQLYIKNELLSARCCWF